VTLFGWNPKYVPILIERHGVEAKIVGSCMVNDEMLDHRAGYNVVMETEIKRRFGARVIEKAQAQAARSGKPTPTTTARAGVEESSDVVGTALSHCALRASLDVP